MILLNLADTFVTPTAVTKAQRSFDKVTYTKDKGIRAYTRELQMISKHILLPIDEYTLRKRIVEVIPSSIRNNIIDLKGLSVRLGYMYPYLYLYVVSLLLVHAWSHQYTPLQHTAARA